MPAAPQPHRLEYSSTIALAIPIPELASPQSADPRVQQGIKISTIDIAEENIHAGEKKIQIAEAISFARDFIHFGRAKRIAGRCHQHDTDIPEQHQRRATRTERSGHNRETVLTLSRPPHPTTASATPGFITLSGCQFDLYRQATTD